MRVAHIKNRAGALDDVPAYDVTDFPWAGMPDWSMRSRKKEPEEYFGIICTFDIETTTIIPKGYAPGEKKQRAGEAPWGFMYHWQMNIGGVNVYGRYWMEWVHFMQKISRYLGVTDQKRLIVWVHNLSFEAEFIMPFLNEYFGGFTIFAAKHRKIMKLTTESGIEFRCSYFLSNMSLYAATKNEYGVQHPKAKDDLEYKKRRTAETFLDDTEWVFPPRPSSLSMV